MVDRAPKMIWLSSPSTTRPARVRPSTCLPGVDVNGAKAAWSSWLGVPNRFSWQNEGGSIAPVLTAGRHELTVLPIDHPVGQNAAITGSRPWILSA